MRSLHNSNLIILASTFPRWANDTVPGFVLAFVRHIAPSFGKITVVAPHYKGARRKETFSPGIAVRRFRYAYPYEYENVAYGQFKKTRFYPFKMLLYIASEFWATLLVSLRTRPKIINAHWLIPQGFVAVLVAPLVGAKTVISIHGSDVFTLNGKYMRKVKRFILQRAGAVVTNSSATQGKCKEFWPSREYPIIPMGIDTEKFDLPREPHQGYRVLFVGRLVPNKGVRHLCEAVSLLHKQYYNMCLEVIGDGPERSALEQYVADNNLQDVITFAGWVQPEILPMHYAATDVFVGPSIEDEHGAREALGLVFAEASAAGLPVVATDVGGIKDIVQDKVTGIIVHQKDIQAIADAIIYLYDHPQEARAMGERGQKTVREKFSWGSVAERYIDVFDKLIA